MKNIKYLLIWLLFLFSASTAVSGPPFRTDDPEPVGYHHGEAYLFSAGTRDAGGMGGVGPAVEFNYGPLPDVMVHLVAPMAYESPKEESSHFGYGDTEFGVKYRVVHETAALPSIGVFPLAEIPSGDADKGLGNGKTQYFLPIWIQKNYGKWTSYGGAGYWINPGPGSKDYWFSGVLVQYGFSESFYLGGEYFYQTADTESGDASHAFNFGGSLPLGNSFQLLFSAGRGLTNTSSNQLSYYIALYRSF